MKFKYILPLFVLLACGKKPTPDLPAYPDPELSARLTTYNSLNEAYRDGDGFLETDTCDALLFTSLSSFHKAINIWAAYDAASGQWHRTPKHDCYPDRSKSTISRDMLLGVLWYAYIHDDLKLAESIWDYGSSHEWVMGQGPESRTKFNPAIKATLAQLIYKLGGADHYWERTYPLDLAWLPGSTDFEAHVQVWHILLRLRVYDKIESSAFARLKEQANREPENALFQYANGDVERAIELLKNPAYFPVEHLPTSADRCGHWLFERDKGDDWLPCDEGKTHTGGDFTSLAFLITEGR